MLMAQKKRNIRYTATKYRVYPTEEQAIFFAQTCGCARYVYNGLLARAIKHYEETGGFRIDCYKTLYNDENIWLKDADSFAYVNAYTNLRTAFKNFFEGLKKGRRAGFPRYKSKKRDKASYTTNNNAGQIRFENGRLRLPKAGFVDGVFHTFVKGRIKSATVSKTKSGKWFVTILAESEIDIVENEEPIEEDEILGIDLAFEGRFAVFSDGRKANFPNAYTRGLKRLGRLQKQFARSEKDSHNREKLRLRIARLYERMHNILEAYLQELSTDIARHYRAVVVEDVDLKAMAQMGHGRQVLNEGFGRFRALLEEKLRRNGGMLIVADRFFPSSQICSTCGWRNRATKDLKLKRYECPECGTRHQRDENAALNLVEYGTAATVGIACGWECKTCGREHCSLVQAVPAKQEKIGIIPSQTVSPMPSGLS